MRCGARGIVLASQRQDTVSIEGRYAYLQALQEYWPDGLISLQHDVLPVYEPRWEKTDSGMFGVIESWETARIAYGENSELIVKLGAWAERFLVTEAWMFEAALYTLLWHCPQMREGHEKIDKWLWRYTPSGFHATFEPTFTKNFWYPLPVGYPETWDQFRKRMLAEFRRQLAAYKTTVETRFGVGREKRLRTEAGWTARYQKGESAADIVQTIDIGDLIDPEQATYRAIERFAKSIGLNLRKRGVRPKRTSVRPRP